MLPLEICEEILDHLWKIENPESKRALVSCLLVAHSWGPTCRLHLYRSIELESKRQFLRFLDTVASTPSFGCLVREVLISGEFGGQIDTSWINTVPVYLPPLLPNVDILTLEHLPPLHQTFIPLLSNFPTVKKLILIGKYSFTDTTRLVNRLPRIQSLDISNGQWTQGIRGFSRKQHQLEFLDAMHIDGQYAIDLLQWVTSSRSPSMLNHLQFNLNVPEAIPAFSGLLQVCGNTLRSLKLWVETDGSDSIEESSLLGDNVLLRELRELRISGLPLSMLPAFSCTLRQLTAPNLQELALQPFSETVAEFFDFDSEWKQIDDILSDSKFPRLENFVLYDCDELNLELIDLRFSDKFKLPRSLENLLSKSRQRDAFTSCNRRGDP